MFKKNERHRQTDMFSAAMQLSEKRQRMLERSWAETFYRDLFCRIDEEIFRCLYSDEWSRPNAPINQLVAFEIVRAGRGWSDEETYEAFCFDMQVRHAIGLRDLREEVFALRTVYNFRRAVARHMETTGEDLIDQVFRQITKEQLRALKVQSSQLRMDSTQIASNVRTLSRLELLVLVVQRMYRALDDDDRATWQVEFEPFVSETARRYAYRLRDEEPQQHLRRLGALMERLACELEAKYSETRAYQVLRRVLDEQFSVVNHLAMLRPDEERSARSVQSPHDLEATYRIKKKRAYRGYVANVAETCDEKNKVQLIVEVAVESNSVDDAQMLADAVDGLAERTDVTTIYADGGYNGPEADEKLAGNKIDLLQTGIRGGSAEGVGRDEFDWDCGDEGVPLAVGCPGGQRVKAERGRKDHTFLARFDSSACEECPLQQQCPTERRKRHPVRVLRFTKQQALAARRRRLSKAMQCSGRNPRAAVEATIWSLKAPLPRGRVPHRGKARVTMYTVAAAAMVNIRRITAMRQKQLKAGPEARSMVASAVGSHLSGIARHLASGWARSLAWQVHPRFAASPC
jgi:hypothetical protein